MREIEKENYLHSAIACDFQILRKSRTNSVTMYNFIKSKKKPNRI